MIASVLWVLSEHFGDMRGGDAWAALFGMIIAIISAFVAMGFLVAEFVLWRSLSDLIGPRKFTKGQRLILVLFCVASAVEIALTVIIWKDLVEVQLEDIWLILMLALIVGRIIFFTYTNPSAKKQRLIAEANAPEEVERVQENAE